MSQWTQSTLLTSHYQVFKFEVNNKTLPQISHRIRRLFDTRRWLFATLELRHNGNCGKSLMRVKPPNLRGFKFSKLSSQLERKLLSQR